MEMYTTMKNRTTDTLIWMHQKHNDESKKQEYALCDSIDISSSVYKTSCMGIEIILMISSG